MIKAHPLLHEVEAYQVPAYDSVDLKSGGLCGALCVCVFLLIKGPCTFVHSDSRTSSKTPLSYIEVCSHSW